MALMTLASTILEESDRNKADLIKQWILSTLDYSGLDRGRLICFRDSISFYSTELPDVQQWMPSQRSWIMASLVDQDVKNDLEMAGLINWCPKTSMVLPLSVPKDGNCLLHSVSTAIWGVSDRGLMLRRLLGLVLSIDCDHRFYRRWLHLHQQQLSPLVSWDQKHINSEWTEVTQCLDPDNSAPLDPHTSRATPHRFLEAVHVYAVANVMRRPIIVVTDPTLRTFSGLSLQDNDMGGIYLPLEWRSEDTCHSPIFLAYTYSHFTPLVVTGRAPQGPCLLPLLTRQLQQLSVRFLLKREEAEVGILLDRYLKVEEICMVIGGQRQSILCTQMKHFPLKDELCLVKSYFRDKLLHSKLAAGYTIPEPRPLLLGSLQASEPGSSLGPPVDRKCVVPGCKHYGDLELAMMCSQCFKDYSVAESRRMVQTCVARSIPTAPLLQEKEEEREQPLSMMVERCLEGCGFRCSTHTYPYCHECADKCRKRAEEEQKVSEAAVDRSSQAIGGTNAAASSVSQTAEGGKPENSRASPTLLFQQQEGGEGQKKSELQAEIRGLPQATVGPQSPQVSGENGGLAMISPTLALKSTPLTPPDDLNDQFLFGTSHPTLPRALPVVPSQLPLHPHSPPPLSPVSPLLHPHPHPPPVNVLGEVTLPTEGQAPLMPLRLENTDPHVHSHPPASVLGSVPLACPHHLEKPVLEPLLLSSNTPVAPVVVAGAAALASGETCSKCHAQPAKYKKLCCQCFIGNDICSREHINPALLRMRMTSLQSTPSSAPERLNCTTGQETQAAGSNPNPSPKLRQRSNSLTHLPQAALGNSTFVQDWLMASSKYHGQETHPTSLQENISLGLPERQIGEMEVLKNDDLIVSGGCGSPPRCVAEGCHNSVQMEGQLCSRCKEILKSFHQPSLHSSVIQEANSNQPRCRNEGCPFFGIRQNLGFCSDCYARQFNRQLEEEGRRHTVQNPTIQLSTAAITPTLNLLSPSFPPVQQGRKCVSQGCSLFGDPKQNNMCFSHYQDYLHTFTAPASIISPSASAGQSPKHRRLNDNMSMQTASLEYQPERNQHRPVQVEDLEVSGSSIGMPAGWGESGSFSMLTRQFGEPYVQSIPPVVPTHIHQQLAAKTPSRVAGETSSSARSVTPHTPGAWEDLSSLSQTYSRLVPSAEKCHNPYCSNYGNPQKRGYCNSCWDQNERDRSYGLGREENG